MVLFLGSDLVVQLQMHPYLWKWAHPTITGLHTGPQTNLTEGVSRTGKAGESCSLKATAEFWCNFTARADVQVKHYSPRNGPHLPTPYKPIAKTALGILRNMGLLPHPFVPNYRGKGNKLHGIRYFLRTQLAYIN